MSNLTDRQRQILSDHAELIRLRKRVKVLERLLSDLVKYDYSAHVALTKPEDQWDEYDYGILPYWVEAVELVDGIKD